MRLRRLIQKLLPKPDHRLKNCAWVSADFHMRVGMREEMKALIIIGAAAVGILLLAALRKQLGV